MALPEERVFRYIPYLVLAGGLMLLLALPMPFIGWVLFLQEGDPWVYWVFLSMGLLVGGFGLYFIWRFNGRFHVTARQITLKRFGQTTTLAFQDISQMEKRDSLLVPFLRLHTAAGTLDISSQIQNYNQLEKLLRQNLAHLVEETPRLPLTLRLPQRYYLGNLALFLLLALLIGGLMLFPGGENFWEAVPFVLGFLAIFMGVIGLVVLLAENVYPYKVVLTETAVSAHYLHKTITIPKEEIQTITRPQRTASYKGFKRVTYPIVIIRTEGKPWTLEERRIWSFGYTPDQLFALLQQTFLSP